MSNVKLINADNLIALLEDAKYDHEDSEITKIRNQEINHCIELVRNFPPTNIAVTGHWKRVCSTQYWQYNPDHYKCTACGSYASSKSKFCRECGAIMEN